MNNPFNVFKCKRNQPIIMSILFVILYDPLSCNGWFCSFYSTTVKGFTLHHCSAVIRKENTKSISWVQLVQWLFFMHFSDIYLKNQMVVIYEWIFNCNMVVSVWVDIARSRLSGVWSREYWKDISQTEDPASQPKPGFFFTQQSVSNI